MRSFGEVFSRLILAASLENGAHFVGLFRRKSPIASIDIAQNMLRFRRAGDHRADLWLRQQPCLSQLVDLSASTVGPSRQVLDDVVVAVRHASLHVTISLATRARWRWLSLFILAG